MTRAGGPPTETSCCPRTVNGSQCAELIIRSMSEAIAVGVSVKVTGIVEGSLCSLGVESRSLRVLCKKYRNRPPDRNHCAGQSPRRDPPAPAPGSPQEPAGTDCADGEAWMGRM